MQPTLAINAVQGNADPYYYARYRSQATAVMTYLGSLGTSSTRAAVAPTPAASVSGVLVADGCSIGGDAKQLAGHLVEVMAAGHLTVLEDR